MKKYRKISIYSTLFLTLTLLLSGCVSHDSHNKPTGFIWDYIGKPVGDMITSIANWIGGPNSYGWAIIIITLVVRLFLLPLMLNQTKKSTTQQEKMARLKPQMDLITAAQKKATTQEEKLALSTKMQEVYKANNVSMLGGIGCLPILIQLPIFSALYAAIQYIPNIKNIMFFGISLGKSSILLAVLSAVAYLIQGYLSLLGLPEDQKKQMQTMIYMSPIMTFVFTMISNAGLGLYFFAGGLIAIIQQLITTYIQRPRIKKQIDQELKDTPPVVVVTPENINAIVAGASAVAPANTTNVNTKQQPSSKDNRKRNAGKQQHHNK